MEPTSVAGRVVGWARRDHGTALDESLLIVALPLLRLPVVINHAYEWPLRWLLMSPFVLGGLRNLWRVCTRRAARVDGRLALLYTSYLGVLSFAHLRAIWSLQVPVAETLDSWAVVLVIGLYSALTFLAAPRAEEQARLRLAILVGLVVYLAVNVALYLGGVSHPDLLYRKGFPSAVMGLLGLSANSVLFPMAAGINNLGTLAGGAAAMAGALLLRPRRPRSLMVVALIGLALGIIVAAMTDVRASLVFCLLTMVLVACLPARRMGGLRLLAILPILVPPLFLLVLRAIPADWWTALGEGARQTANLSNRETIWSATWAELLAFRPIHLVGYGYLGHATSGISQAYLYHFPAYIYSHSITAHNAFLQMVLESGYIGTAILVTALVRAIAGLAGHDGAGVARPDSRALLGLLAFIMLAGITESTWSPMYQELQVCLLIGLASAAVFSQEERGASARQAPELAGGRP